MAETPESNYIQGTLRLKKTLCPLRALGLPALSPALLGPVSDIAYRDGSIYHAASREPMFLAAATIVMTTALLMGLLRRQKRGVANIGFEGLLVLGLYMGMMAMLLVM